MMRMCSRIVTILKEVLFQNGPVDQFYDAVTSAETSTFKYRLSIRILQVLCSIYLQNSNRQPVLKHKHLANPNIMDRAEKNSIYYVLQYSVSICRSPAILVLNLEN